MEKTIAKKYVLSAIIAMLNGEDTTVTTDKDEVIHITSADMMAYAEHEIELLAKKSAKKSTKAIPAETIERMDLVEQVMIDLFDDPATKLTDGGVSPSQILGSGKFAPGTSTQLLRSTLVLLQKDGRVVEIERKPKSAVWKLAD